MSFNDIKTIIECFYVKVVFKSIVINLKFFIIFSIVSLALGKIENSLMLKKTETVHNVIKRYTCWRLKASSDKLKYNIYTYVYASSRNPKRDLGGMKYWRFARNTLSETKIQNLHS